MILPEAYRTVRISDVHLGTRGCRAEYLLEFLRATPCDQLYIAGDFIDLWAMRRAVSGSIPYRGPAHRPEEGRATAPK